MYIDDEALYIMVSVSDNNHYASVSDTSHFDSYDSIQIAVDSEGTGLSRYVNEFVAVYDGNRSVLYKKKAASTDASVPDDFHLREQFSTDGIFRGKKMITVRFTK